MIKIKNVERIYSTVRIIPTWINKSVENKIKGTLYVSINKTIYKMNIMKAKLNL
jgi:hypothetical protein